MGALRDGLTKQYILAGRRFEAGAQQAPVAWQRA
jgi:hypothetical protein